MEMLDGRCCLIFDVVSDEMCGSVESDSFKYQT